MRGPESTIYHDQIRQCSLHNNQASLDESQLGDTIRRPGTELVRPMRVISHDPFLLAGNAKCHQLYKPPGELLGVCCCLVVQVNSSSCKQYCNIWQQPLPREVNPGSASVPHPSILCTALEPAQPLSSQ